MHQKLQDRLKDDFPGVAWTGTLAHWGIECGTGWGLLVYGFMSDATQLCEKGGGTLAIAQIKEKFGQLRIYCSSRDIKAQEAKYDYAQEFFGHLTAIRPYPQNPTLRSLVDYYEGISSSYCELCGKAGHIDDAVTAKTHWATSLCYEHAGLMIESRRKQVDAPFVEIDKKTCEKIVARIDEIHAKRTQ